jgi:hypothetical protein
MILVEGVSGARLAPLVSEKLAGDVDWCRRANALCQIVVPPPERIAPVEKNQQCITPNRVIVHLQKSCFLGGSLSVNHSGRTRKAFMASTASNYPFSSLR